LILYLDSSAILKRYVQEKGTEKVREVYFEALNGEKTLSLSVWNIGEVLGALDKYLKRGWLGAEEHGVARGSFIDEMTRLIRLGVVKLVPVKASILASSWGMIERYGVYQADAVQVVSAKSVQADQLLTGDRRLAEVSELEGVGALFVG